MVRYILNRPIAVSMITGAFILFGIIATFNLQTSLIPAVPSPRISIFVNAGNLNSKEIQKNIVNPLRNVLQQVEGLNNIHCESRDGMAQFLLNFEFGNNIELAFIETNEKIEFALPLLPRNIDRPIVIKSSASDIPAAQIVISQNSSSVNLRIEEFSDFVYSVIKKRIEQLPQVALADISGYQNQEILIEMDTLKLSSLGLTPSDIAQRIKVNNLQYSDLRIEEGNYEYSIQISNSLAGIDDLRNLRINLDGQIFALGDLASISFIPEKSLTRVFFNDKRSILLSIIKKSDAKFDDLDYLLSELLFELRREYPELEFTKIKDQAQLLRLSLSNLNNSLLLGCILSMIIMFLFTKNWKSALLTGVSIPISLIISILILYVCGISINMLSLSGLILGVGMMIDNSIIVLDNIDQEYYGGSELVKSCVDGTNMVISPLISSMLSTCSVFFPLIFLSGIAGALFFDQAMAVSICLLSSFLVSIVLIPLLYMNLNSKKRIDREIRKKSRLEKFYDWSYDYFIVKRKVVLFIALLIIALGILATKNLSVERLPSMAKNEIVINIEWNENINPFANYLRTNELVNGSRQIEDALIEVGPQQFLANRERIRSNTEVSLYIKTDTQKSLDQVQSYFENRLNTLYPDASYKFTPVKNVFDFVFNSSDNYLTAKIFSFGKSEVPDERDLPYIKNLLGPWDDSSIKLKTISIIEVNMENLILYDVDHTVLLDELRTLLNENQVDYLRGSRKIIPIKLGYGNTKFFNHLNSFQIKNKIGQYIPLASLIEVQQRKAYEKITSDNTGEYLGIHFDNKSKVKEVIYQIENRFKNNQEFGVRFGGEYNELKKINHEFLLIIIVSFLLLYLIMAAQFESTLLPFIILLELPIDIGASLIGLYFFGSSLNIMAGIGIVVLSGIVINDSILKIHTILKYIENGEDSVMAIKKASKKRVRPILMTSLTTILALLPIMIIPGLGSDIQRPMAIVIIVGLAVGTFVSIYLIPLFFKYYLRFTNQIG